MSSQAYEDYEAGHDEGTEVAEDPDALQTHIDVWRGHYSGKSEMWWQGFQDGKEGVWAPPPEEEDEEDEDK